MLNMLSFLYWIVVVTVPLLKTSSAIKVAKCRPPDFPIDGGYGPKKEFYVTGDVVHYYCNIGTYLDGEYRRYCKENGRWAGDTPVCDPNAIFSDTSQSTTAEPLTENRPELAADGLKSTCSSTAEGQNGTAYWIGTLAKPGYLIRFAVILPRGSGPFNLIIMTEEDEPIHCGGQLDTTKSIHWMRVTCRNMAVKAKAVVVRALDRDLVDRIYPYHTDQDPKTYKNVLQVCEVYAEIIPVPACSDPHFSIENGCLSLSRKRAQLVCDVGFEPGIEQEMECVSNDVWSRKPLYCNAKEAEDDVAEVTTNSNRK